MINFDKEKVLLLHQLIIEETGGKEGLRDHDLLDSALNDKINPPAMLGRTE